MTTLGDAKKKALNKLVEAKIVDEIYELISLLSYSLGKSEIDIVTEDQITLSQNQLFNIEKNINRRISGEPLSYITNIKKFYNEEFYINNKVLVPRFETEELIDFFLKLVSKEKTIKKRLLDIGTGSGVISIILEKEMPSLEIYAIEKSKEAFEVAKTNMKNKNSKIKLIQEDIKNSKLYNIDFVVSNPPYIKSDIIENLSEEVKREPRIALDGGKEGINVIEDIFIWEKNINKNKASIILIEIDESIIKNVKKLSEKFYTNKKIEFIRDLSNNTRFLSIIT
jgi:release factor glutamine methyltransferase|tara:strand:+ start:7278 stop:8123 length:846 start_codon:yes stop_codon:yes gene_type:complete